MKVVKIKGAYQLMEKVIGCISMQKEVNEELSDFHI